MKLCSPALVYLVVSFATFVYDVLVMRITANMVLGKSVIVVASTFLLNWLCRGGYAKVAWSILPLPIILFVWTVSIKEGKKNRRQKRRPKRRQTESQTESQDELPEIERQDEGGTVYKQTQSQDQKRRRRQTESRDELPEILSETEEGTVYK